METSATIETTPQRCRVPASTGAAVSEQRQLGADQTIILTSDLPDAIPVLPEELELMRIYFGDLISTALTGDA